MEKPCEESVLATPQEESIPLPNEDLPTNDPSYSPTSTSELNNFFSPLDDILSESEGGYPSTTGDNDTLDEPDMTFCRPRLPVQVIESTAAKRDSDGDDEDDRIGSRPMTRLQVKARKPIVSVSASGKQEGKSNHAHGFLEYILLLFCIYVC